MTAVCTVDAPATSPTPPNEGSLLLEPTGLSPRFGLLVAFVPEYTWMDRVNGFRGFLDSAAVLYPQLQDIDLRVVALSLDIPFYMIAGEHTARGRAVLADEWYDLFEAPRKQRIVFGGTGHRPHFDQPELFADVMRAVLDDTQSGVKASD